MDCTTAREALSASLDDELAAGEAGALAAHLEGCSACRAVGQELELLHRVTRVRAADAVPDLVPSIMAAVELPKARRQRDLDWSRYALLAVAATQLILALPLLLLGEDPGATVHVARELGAFDVALAAGLLLAAWQPWRAAGLLPFAAALAAITTITSVVDVVAGRASFGSEAHHLLDLVGLVLLWLVAQVPEAPARRRRQGTVLA